MIDSKEVNQLWEDEYANGMDGTKEKLKPATYDPPHDLPTHWWTFLRPRYLQGTDILLEVGCGVGNKIAGIHPFVKEVHGFDISKTAIEYGKKRFNGIDKVHLSVADNLDAYDDDFFDIIYCDGVFMHMIKDDTRKYLCEFKNKLKPNGFIFFMVVYYKQMSEGMPGGFHYNGTIPSTSWEEAEIRRAITDANLKVHSLSTWDISWQVRNPMNHLWIACTRHENQCSDEWRAERENQ